MSRPFSSLSLAQAERLDVLAEECAEVIQAIMKIKRHGYAVIDPRTNRSYNNRSALVKELGDVGAALDLMYANGDIPILAVERAREEKSKTVLRYMHHQNEDV